MIGGILKIGMVNLNRLALPIKSAAQGTSAHWLLRTNRVAAGARLGVAFEGKRAFDDRQRRKMETLFAALKPRGFDLGDSVLRGRNL